MGYELMTQLEGKLAGLSHAIKSCSSAMDILNMCALVDVNERPFSFCRRLIWVKYIYTDYPHTVVHPIDYCINRYFNFLKNVACYCVFAGKAKSACTRCFVFCDEGRMEFIKIPLLNLVGSRYYPLQKIVSVQVYILKDTTGKWLNKNN